MNDKIVDTNVWEDEGRGMTDWLVRIKVKQKAK